jgi:hypothetical protein
VCDINGTESAIKTTRRNQIRIYLHILLLLEMILFSVCLCTVLPKTSFVNKDFFNHLHSSHLTLPMYASSSFLRPWGSLIELVKKNQGPFLADPVVSYLEMEGT